MVMPPKDRLREVDQIPTRLVSIQKIMSDPAFQLGVADARAGRPMHRDYDLWATNTQWSYERGRQWAKVASPEIVLKRNGSITGEAVELFRRNGEAIL